MKIKLPVYLLPIVDQLINGLTNFQTAVKNEVSRLNPKKSVYDSSLYFKTQEELALFCKCSRRTIYHYAKKGLIPLTYLANGKILYLRSDYEYLVNHSPLFTRFTGNEPYHTLTITPVEVRDGIQLHKFRYGNFSAYNSSPFEYTLDQIQLACMLILLSNHKITEKEYEDCKCALAA